MASITEIKINLNTRTEGKVKAFANITLDSAFVVTGIKIVEGVKGLFVSFPQQKLSAPRLNRRTGKMEEYIDLVFPITKECRETIQNSVLNAYQSEIQRVGVNTGGGFVAPVLTPIATAAPAVVPAPAPVVAPVEGTPFDTPAPVAPVGGTPRVNIPNVQI